MIRIKKEALIIKQGHFSLYLFWTECSSLLGVLGLARNKRVDAYRVRDRQRVASTIKPGQIPSKEYGANPDHRALSSQGPENLPTSHAESRRLRCMLRCGEVVP